MKKWILLSIVSVLALSGKAQQPVAEPEFNSVFMALDGGKLLPLEPQTAIIHTRASGFMVMKTSSTFEFSGARSPVRFQSGKPLEFIVRTASKGEDPKNLYVLQKLASKKKTREVLILTGRFSPFNASLSPDLSAGSVPVKFSPYGANSIKLEVGTLAPGEYALKFIGAPSAFCFGVD